MLNHQELLDKLKSIRFSAFWPDHPYDSLIGFTEREIWVNSTGWGCYACDELNPVFLKLEKLPPDRWTDIREKLQNGDLTIKDIEDTSLEELCESLDYDDGDTEWLNFTLSGLLGLSGVTDADFYCTTKGDEYVFLHDYEKAPSLYERSDVVMEWTEMSDEDLIRWLELLQQEDAVNWES